MFQLAVTYDQKACELAPHSIRWGRWHALSLRNAAFKLRELGQQDEALSHLRKVVTIRDRLVFQNPAVSSLRAEHYQDLLVLADHLKQMEATVEANRAYRDAKNVLGNWQKRVRPRRNCFNLLLSTLPWPRMFRLRRPLKRLKMPRPLMNDSEMLILPCRPCCKRWTKAGAIPPP